MTDNYDQGRSHYVLWAEITGLLSLMLIYSGLSRSITRDQQPFFAPESILYAEAYPVIYGTYGIGMKRMELMFRGTRKNRSLRAASLLLVTGVIQNLLYFGLNLRWFAFAASAAVIVLEAELIGVYGSADVVTVIMLLPFAMWKGYEISIILAVCLSG